MCHSFSSFTKHKIRRLNKLIFLFVFISSPVFANEIKPFTTDACSLFPNGKMDELSKWMACCIKHDLAYWKGGTEQERKNADLELKNCVAEMGEKNISLLMYMGVRFGGDPFFPTWYRWGYGWPYLRGYQKINKNEKKQIKKRLVELKTLIEELIESETK